MGSLALVASHARRADLSPKFVRVLPGISLLLVIAGSLNSAWLPSQGQYRHTYFSENALLAHQAITFFRETEWNIVRGFKGQVRQYYDLNTTEIERNAESIDIFHDFGLQAHTHNWESLDGTQSGQNIYAMHMASRGPHNEAIVIAAPWLADNGDFNEGGTALLISLARFFQRWNFWHKNLIFVIPSNSDIALRQWVNAYHSTLQYTAGSIEGAVVLDYAFDAEFFDHVDICFEGLNGQLPNSDLVNTAIHSVSSEFSQVRTSGSERVPKYENRLTSMSRHIWQQMGAGLRKDSRCASSMFSGWRIDAITLRAVPGNSHFDITTLGRICESTVRSINNLSEHFHQSFFFYLSLGPTYFVSIASYLPSVMLISSSFSILALHRLAKAQNIAANVWSALLAFCVIFSASCVGIYVPSFAFAAGSFALLVVFGGYLSISMSFAQKTLLNAISLALVGSLLTTSSMVNFSLASGLGVACVPLAWVNPAGKFNTNFMLATSASPPSVLAALAIYGMNESIPDLVTDLIWSWRESNVWTWALISLIWLPLWTVSLICL